MVTLVTELREELEEHWNQVGHSKPVQQKAAVQLYQAFLRRWRIEVAFGSLKDFRRIATHYDRLGRNYLSLRDASR